MSSFTDPRQGFDTIGQTFLRGVQTTDPRGQLTLTGYDRSTQSIDFMLDLTQKVETPSPAPMPNGSGR